MANRLLLQSIVKFRDQIKDGTAKVFDIVEDYFSKTGKTVTEEERALILNEFAKDAPSNVTPLKSRAFDEVIRRCQCYRNYFTYKRYRF